MRTGFKRILRRLKLPLSIWSILPKYIKKIWPKYFIKKDNKELLKILLRKIDKNSGAIIVIGANDGYSFDDIMPGILYHCHKSELASSLFYIEPIPYYYNKLNDYLSSYNKEVTVAISYNYALHPSKSRETIYMVDPYIIEHNDLPKWLAGSSSFSYELLKNSHELPHDAIISVSVECANFDYMVKKINSERTLKSSSNPYKFSYLQIDTEGFDDQIIEMIDFKKYIIDILKFEKSHFSKTKLLEIIQKLDQYVCFDFGEDEVCIRID